MRHNTSWVLLLAALSFGGRLMAQEPYTLAPLPYAYNALEPAIDAQTMEIHYSRHHADYVKNLNKAVKGTRLEKWEFEDILIYADKAGDAARNNAGGHYNHTLFWEVLAKDKPFAASTEVGKAVLETFTSVDSLKRLMVKTAKSRFGSGWVWLYVTPQHKLAVCSTPNQDNPIMGVSAERGIPVLGIDVWEHAYYLKYQNKRMDYVPAVFDIINWEAVNKRYTEALNAPLLKVIEKDTWTELKDFHKVMARTFHPVEEGNFAPLKEQSGDLLSKARALQSGKIPASFDNADIKKAIGDLVSGAEKLHKMVTSKKKDEKLKDEISRLHDIFHTIQGLCVH